MIVRESLFLALSVLSGAIVTFGVLFNGLVCLTFLKYRSSLLKRGNTIVFSMAVSDLLCSAVALPMAFVSNVKKQWVFKDAGCSASAFIVTWCGLVSITHLAALAYNRYEKISFREHKLTSTKKVIGVVFALWLYAFLFAIAPVASWSRYSVEGIGTSCSVEWSSTGVKAVSYTVCLFIGFFVLPIVVIVLSYYKFYKALKNMTRKSSHSWGRRSVLARKTARTEKRMATIFLVMIAAFLVAWSPYATVSLISACGKSSWLNLFSSTIPGYFAKLSLIYNPVIYFLMYKRFRIRVISLFQFCSLYDKMEETSSRIKMLTFSSKKKRTSEKSESTLLKNKNLRE